MKKRLFQAWPYLVLALVLLLVDIVTKKLTVNYFHEAFLQQKEGLYQLGQEIELLHLFLGVSVSLTYASNQGAAWGVFSTYPHLLLALRLVMITGLFFYLTCFQSAKQFRLPLVLIITGAIGNVIDFFVYGHVVDMIHCIFWGYDYPVFNIADCLICIGTFLILFRTLFFEEKPL